VESEGGVRFGLYDGRTRVKPAAGAQQARQDADAETLAAV